MAAKYFGPFQILARVGEVAYRLKLPEGARVHSMFHVSLLKRKVGVTQQVEASLPEVDASDQCLLKPEKILQRRVVMRAAKPVIQYLVKWNNLPESEASWEDKSFIDRQFPEFQA